MVGRVGAKQVGAGEFQNLGDEYFSTPHILCRPYTQFSQDIPGTNRDEII